MKIFFYLYILDLSTIIFATKIFPKMPRSSSTRPNLDTVQVLGKYDPESNARKQDQCEPWLNDKYEEEGVLPTEWIVESVNDFWVDSTGNWVGYFITYKGWADEEET